MLWEPSPGACRKTDSQCRNPASEQGSLLERPYSQTWFPLHRMPAKVLSSRCGGKWHIKVHPTPSNSAPFLARRLLVFFPDQNHELWQTTQLKACNWSKWSFTIFQAAQPIQQDGGMRAAFQVLATINFPPKFLESQSSSRGARRVCAASHAVPIAHLPGIKQLRWRRGIPLGRE